MQNESRFNRGARLIVGIVVFWFLWGAIGMLLLFSLPTDGWLSKPPDQYGTNGYIYVQNLVGAPSELQPGDHVIAIDGITLAGPELNFPTEKWRVGNTVIYTVERGEVNTDIPVPLVSWQLVPALIFWIQQIGIPSAVGVFAFLAVAALAFYKRPNDHAARTLLLFAALFPTLGSFVGAFISTPTASVFPIVAVMGIATTVIAYTILFPPILLNFALVFPHSKPLLKQHPRVEYVPYLVGTCIIPLFAITGGLAGYAWTISSIVGTILIMTHSAFTMRDALSRAQLRWGLWGFILGMLMFLSTYLVTFGGVTGIPAQIINVLVSLSFSVLGITLGIAILRYRLFEIDVIIRRTVTYAIVVGLSAVIYFGCVILLQQAFASITGQRSEVITVLSTLAIAALFVPLRNRVQAVIDRRFNRNKYDAQRVLQKFGERVRDETDLEKLTMELVKVVQQTMQPRSISLWLKAVDDRQRKAGQK